MNNNSGDKPTRIFFVRHGVTDQTGKVMYGRTQGIMLNEQGREQAENLAQYLEPVTIDAVYSSPLERAFETASIVTRDRELEIKTDEELSDTHIGDWTNLELKQCAELEDWKKVLSSPSQFKFPNGESFMDVFDRMNKAVHAIASANLGKNVVVTSHRDPIIILLASYLGLHMDLFQRIPCQPASLAEVKFFNGIATVESVNVLPAKRMV